MVSKIRPEAENEAAEEDHDEKSGYAVMIFRRFLLWLLFSYHFFPGLLLVNYIGRELLLGDYQGPTTSALTLEVFFKSRANPIIKLAFCIIFTRLIYNFLACVSCLSSVDYEGAQ